MDALGYALLYSFGASATHRTFQQGRRLDLMWLMFWNDLRNESEIHFYWIRTFSKVWQIQGTWSLEITAAPSCLSLYAALFSEISATLHIWFWYLTVGLFPLICNICAIVQYFGRYLLYIWYGGAIGVHGRPLPACAVKVNRVPSLFHSWYWDCDYFTVHLSIITYFDVHVPSQNTCKPYFSCLDVILARHWKDLLWFPRWRRYRAMKITVMVQSCTQVAGLTCIRLTLHILYIFDAECSTAYVMTGFTQEYFYLQQCKSWTFRFDLFDDAVILQTVCMKDGFAGSWGLGYLRLLRNLCSGAVVVVLCMQDSFHQSNTARPNDGFHGICRVFITSLLFDVELIETIRSTLIHTSCFCFGWGFGGLIFSWNFESQFGGNFWRELYGFLLTTLHDNQNCLDVPLDKLRIFGELYSLLFAFMLMWLFLSISIGWMQHNMRNVFHSCGTSHCIVLFAFSDDPVIFQSPFTQRGAMAISIPMVPYASNKGIGEKKPLSGFSKQLERLLEGYCGDICNKCSTWSASDVHQALCQRPGLAACFPLGWTYLVLAPPGFGPFH